MPQHVFLDSLVLVVFDNRISLDFILTKHRGVCVLATGCTYTNTSGEVESLMNRLFQKATWLQNEWKEDPLQDLIFLVAVWDGRVFSGILQRCVLIIIFIVIHLLMFIWLSRCLDRQSQRSNVFLMQNVDAKPRTWEFLQMKVYDYHFSNPEKLMLPPSIRK